MGSWRKELLRPLLCILSNTCWNGGVHPSLRCSSKSPFAHTLTHLSRDPTVSDGETSSGSICEFWLSSCVGLGSTCTCVFVFVSQQWAALLEDLITQVTGVHAAVRLLHFLPLRARVGVILLLHSGHAFWVLLLLLENIRNHRCRNSKWQVKQCVCVHCKCVCELVHSLQTLQHCLAVNLQKHVSWTMKLQLTFHQHGGRK